MFSLFEEWKPSLFVLAIVELVAVSLDWRSVQGQRRVQRACSYMNNDLAGLDRSV